MNDSIEDILKWYKELIKTKPEHKIMIGPMGKSAYEHWNRILSELLKLHNKHVTKLGLKHKSQKRLDREVKHKSNYHG
jgi:hypothetical protein